MSIHPAFSPVGSRYGAPMGRRNEYPDAKPARWHVARWRPSDACYDQGGAYWGMGGSIFAGWNRDGLRVYVRAKSRPEAIRLIADAIAERYKPAPVGRFSKGISEYPFTGKGGAL